MTKGLTIKGCGGPPVFYGSLIVGLLSGALGVYSFTLPPWGGVALGGLGTLGALASVATCWSSLHGRRWSWVGLTLGLCYLGITISPPFFLGTFHWFGPLAIFTICVAVLNMRGERTR